MFSIKNIISNFLFFLIVCGLIIGCGPDGGGNNNGEDVDVLDANFGAGGILAIEAEGEEFLSAEQDFKNITAQNRNEQQRRELLLLNRFQDRKQRKNRPFRAQDDDFITAVSFNANVNKIAYAGIIDNVVSKVLIGVSDINGNLDDGFNGDGTVAVNAGAANIGDLSIVGVVLQDDGKVTAVGTITQAGNQNVIAVQVNADGILDATFGGGDGIAIFDDLELINDPNQVQQDQGNSAILSGGNIVISRSSTFDGAQLRAGILIIDNTGTIVSNFSSGLDNSTCIETVVDGNGKLVGVGALAAGSQVFRLNADGTRDNTLDNVDGVIEVAGVNFRSVTVDAANNIIIAGDDLDTTDTFLTRLLNAGGAIDPAFNGGANLVFEPKVGATNQLGLDVFLRDTQIVVVGNGVAGQDNFAFSAILNENGNLASAFESQGFLDEDVINEDFQEGFVDPNNNRVIAVGSAIEDGQGTFDGVAVRIID